MAHVTTNICTLNMYITDSHKRMAWCGSRQPKNSNLELNHTHTNLCVIIKCRSFSIWN